MNTYLTRALLKIDADDPLDAAEQYKDQLASVPLDQWVYRVEDIKTGEMFYVYKGDIYTLEKLQDRLLPPEQVERIRAARATDEGD